MEVSIGVIVAVLIFGGVAVYKHFNSKGGNGKGGPTKGQPGEPPKNHK